MSSYVRNYIYKWIIESLFDSKYFVIKILVFNILIFSYLRSNTSFLS